MNDELGEPWEAIAAAHDAAQEAAGEGAVISARREEAGWIAIAAVAEPASHVEARGETCEAALLELVRRLR